MGREVVVNVGAEGKEHFHRPVDEAVTALFRYVCTYSHPANDTLKP